MTISRRDLLIGTGALAAGASVSLPYLLPRYRQDRRPKRSRVAILRMDDYVQSIQDSLRRGLQLFHLDVKGKTVVLKPNLVDYIPAMRSTRTPFWLSPRPNASASLEQNKLLSRRDRDTKEIRDWYFAKVAMSRCFARIESALST